MPAFVTRARLFIAFFIVLSAMAAGQAPLSCGADLIHRRNLDQEAYRQTEELLEQSAYTHFKQSIAQRGQAIAEVPVVVHIVHRNGPENISDARVLQAVQWLNEAFGRSGVFVQSAGVESSIRFCLARRQPDGSATNGITRTESPLTKLQAESDDAALKDLVRWNPLEYINIWVVDDICSSAYGCDITAYAYRPGSHGDDLDGIVIEAAWMGQDAGYAGTLAHEMGHYFGLYHTFEGGCGNADCLLDGDRICDTPPEQSSAAIPCDQTVNTCSTDALSGFSSDEPDPTRNFMDYGDIRCLNAFTQGQSDRMRFFLDGARSSLLQSKACRPPCTTPVTAAFSPGDLTIAAGTTLSWVSNSQNSSALRWFLNGSPLATPTYTFSQQGLYTISLVATAQNSDLCAEARASALVQVVCAAQANFSLSAQLVAVGEPVLIQNNTQNAVQQEWFVNNVSQGSQLTQFTPPVPGSYLIRLEATGANCRSEQSQYVVVRDSCSEEQFVKHYAWDRNERGVAVQALPDGSAIVYGDARTAQGGSLFIMKLAPDGEVIWARNSNEFNANTYTPQDMVLAPDGGIVLALTLTAAGQDAAVVKYDAEGRYVWGYRIDKPGTDESAVALCTLPGGGYALCGNANLGTLGITPFVLVLSEAGVLQWTRAYDAPGSHFAVDVAAESAHLFLACNQTSPSPNRALVLNLDLQTGVVLWNKRIGGAISNQCVAIRLLSNGLLALAGQNFGNSNPQRMPWIALLQRSDGSFFAGKTLPDRPGGNRLLLKDLLAHPNGEIWLGATEEGKYNACLLRLDANLSQGQMYWYNESLRVLNRMALLPDGGCLLVGNRPNESNVSTDVCLIRTDASGYAGLCTDAPVPFTSGISDLSANDLLFSPLDLPTLQTLNLPLQVFSPKVYRSCAAQPCPPSGANNCYRSSWNYGYKMLLSNYDLSTVNTNPGLCQLSGGDYIIIKRVFNGSHISRIDRQGRVLWSREINMSPISGTQDNVLMPLPNNELMVLSGDSDWLHLDGNGNTLHFWNINLNVPSQTTIDMAITAGNKDVVCAASTFFQLNGYLIFLFRLGSDGQVRWSNLLRYPAEAGVIGMLELSSGDILLRHRSGYTTLIGADGQLKWSKQQIALTSYINSRLILQHTNSDIYLAGSIALAATNNQPVLIHMDKDGNVKRAMRYEALGYYTSLAQAPDGNLLATYSSVDDWEPGAVVKININDLSAATYNYEMQMYEVQTEAGQEAIYLGTAVNSSSDPLVALSKADSSGLPNLCSMIADTLYLNPLSVTESLFTLPIEPYAISVTDTLRPISLALLPEITTICPVECDGAVEICDNLIDDDGDLLIDCADEDCPCTEDDCASKRANLWYFGQKWGLDFSNNPPQFLADGRTYTTGGTAVATDPKGRLVCYAGGDVLYDRFHHPFVGANRVPVLLPRTEVLLTPTPGSNRYFDHFTVDAGSGLQRNRLDPQGNEGLGSTELKDNIWNAWSGQVCATKACAGDAYWLVASVFELTGEIQLVSALIDSTVTVVTPYVAYTPDGCRELKAAPNSKWIAVAGASGQLTLYGFNPANGAFSPGSALVPPAPFTRFYPNMEFSPDSRFLYASVTDSAGTAAVLIQYDLLAGDLARMNASAAVVDRFDNTLPLSMQLGPDRKIYIACRSAQPASVGANHWLAVVHQPNRSSIAALLQQKAIPLFDPYEPGAEFKLPNFPAYYFKTPLVRFRQPNADTICQSGQNTLYSVAHNECSDANIQWRVTGLSANIIPMGDTAMVRYREAGRGLLIVTQNTPCGTVSDTLPVLVLDTAPAPLNLGPDRMLCDKGVVVLDAGAGFASYRWQDGTTEQRLTTLLPGKYSVTVTDACGQTQSDTILISFAAAAGLQLGADRRLCPGDTLTFTRPALIKTWRWSPAASLSCADCARISAAPSQSTTYIASGQSADGCVVLDTLSVEVLPAGSSRLDTTLCPGDALRYQGENIVAGQERRFTLTGFNGCDSVVVVSVGAFPPLAVSLLPADTVLYYGDTLSLNTQITGSAPFDWQWTPPQGLSCTDCTNPLAFPLADVVYTIQVTDDNGCSSADSVRIKVETKCDPIEPNAFTPNGDDLNDWFYPMSYPCTRQMLRLRIYNRWGQLVFERENFKSNIPSLGWDGRKDQVEQPMDEYVWYAEWLRYDGKVESAKGSVTLLR